MNGSALRLNVTSCVRLRSTLSKSALGWFQEVLYGSILLLRLPQCLPNIGLSRAPTRRRNILKKYCCNNACYCTTSFAIRLSYTAWLISCSEYASSDSPYSTIVSNTTKTSSTRKMVPSLEAINAKEARWAHQRKFRPKHNGYAKIKNKSSKVSEDQGK